MWFTWCSNVTIEWVNIGEDIFINKSSNVLGSSVKVVYHYVY